MIVNAFYGGGGGGDFMSIVVTAPTGSTVTATSGGVTHMATEVSGTWTFPLDAFGTYTVTATLSGKSATETVIVDEAKVFAVTLRYVSTTLNDNDWATVQAVAAAGLGSSYWAVGDRHSAAINGTVGALAFSGTYYCFVLGFDHNSAIEGTGIHFQFGKSALSGGVDIAFIDSMYNSYNQLPSFCMNLPDTNSGGWNSSYMRNTICAAFLNALDADLRAVIAGCTKYSDNTGGGGNTASNVTATIDYIFLLAEFEAWATQRYANSAEQNYQAQYAYYANGNSKIKYKHNALSTGCSWWLRSVANMNSVHFCYASNGTNSTYNSYRIYGFAPAFKVA